MRQRHQIPTQIDPYRVVSEGPVTEDQNLAWFAEECQRNHVPMDRLVRMAEVVRDTELAAFFRRAMDVSHQLPHAA